MIPVTKFTLNGTCQLYHERPRSIFVSVKFTNYSKPVMSRIFMMPWLPRRFKTVITESKEISFQRGIYDHTDDRHKIFIASGMLFVALDKSSSKLNTIVSLPLQIKRIPVPLIVLSVIKVNVNEFPEEIMGFCCLYPQICRRIEEEVEGPS